jgi:tetratricopeptide (TPR) repeat protein
MAFPSHPARAFVGGVALLLAFLLGFPASTVGQSPLGADTTDLQNRRAQALFVRGMTQSYLEDYTEAVSYFEQALDVVPDAPAVLAALAEAEAARDNVTSALYYARQARDQAPNQPYYHHTLADLLARANQPREAVAAYRTLIGRFPGQGDARLSLARLLRDQQQPQAALRAYQALVDSTERPPPEAYVEMLELYKQTGSTDGLEQLLERLIERRRDVQSYRRRLGRLYLEEERYAEAIPVYEALLRERPDDPQILSRLQTLYERTGQDEAANALWRTFETKSATPDQLVTRARSLYDDARRESAPLDSSAIAPAVRLLREALDQAPEHAPALTLLGTLRYETGAFDEAATLLQRAIDADPRAPDRWARAASAHLKAGRPQRAVQVAEEGLLLFPGRAALLRPLAFARLRLDEHNTALRRFDEALASVDTTAETVTLRAALHAGRGRAYDRLGEASPAQADYQTALKLDRNQPTALRHYALHLAQRKQNLSRALALARRAVEAFPQDPDALDTLGWVYFRRGAPKKAKTHLQKAVDTGSASAVVYDHLGDVYRALGDDTRARQYWKKALEQEPTLDAVRDKLQSLPQS